MDITFANQLQTAKIWVFPFLIKVSTLRKQKFFLFGQKVIKSTYLHDRSNMKTTTSTTPPIAGENFKLYLLTLGCDKNRVDSEVMLGRLVATGAFTPITDPGHADVIIVNTCGFIKEATQESIDTILEMAAYKSDDKAPCRVLIVTGCMSERYRDAAKEELPEADAILGVKDTDTIVEVVSSLLGTTVPNTNNNQDDPNKHRALSSPYIHNRHIAHIKISDGCNNACTYCTIPSIRGAYKSRPLEDIVAECQLLLKAGAKEFVLVAQDTALYGIDIYNKPSLHQLLREIAALPGKPWIRLMYAYPEHITPEIIQAIADVPNICKYIDMPIQHSETEVLHRMGRKSTREGLLQLIKTLRTIPNIALRTTLMVGFPGETVENFRGLYNFAKEARFERLGVFPYSREEGTPAAKLPKQVKDEVKHTRRERLMRLQQQIHQEKQQAKVGQTIDVIIDEVIIDEVVTDEAIIDKAIVNEAADNAVESPKQPLYIGRTQHDAYEVDAVVRFTTPTQHKPGDIVKVRITGANDYDLQGVLTQP